MHQNYDISSQTEINYRSTINLEALKHARPTRRKNIVWRENVRDIQKRKISSRWLATGFMNKKLPCVHFHEGQVIALGMEDTKFSN